MGLPDEVVSVSTFREPSIHFPEWLCLFTFPHIRYKGSLFPTSSPTLLFLFCKIASFTISAVILHCDSGLHIRDPEGFFIYLLIDYIEHCRISIPSLTSEVKSIRKFSKLILYISMPIFHWDNKLSLSKLSMPFHILCSPNWPGQLFLRSSLPLPHQRLSYQRKRWNNCLWFMSELISNQSSDATSCFFFYFLPASYSHKSDSCLCHPLSMRAQQPPAFRFSSLRCNSSLTMLWCLHFLQ